MSNADVVTTSSLSVVVKLSTKVLAPSVVCAVDIETVVLKAVSDVDSSSVELTDIVVLKVLKASVVVSSSVATEIVCKVEGVTLLSKVTSSSGDVSFRGVDCATDVTMIVLSKLVPTFSLVVRSVNANFEVELPAVVIGSSDVSTIKIAALVDSSSFVVNDVCLVGSSVLIVMSLTVVDGSRDATTVTSSGTVTIFGVIGTVDRDGPVVSTTEVASLVSPSVVTKVVSVVGMVVLRAVPTKFVEGSTDVTTAVFSEVVLIFSGVVGVVPIAIVEKVVVS